jgi:hypothetical protein
VKTGVQSIAKTLKTLDSGFRRNDVKKNRTDFFTPSLFQRGKKRNLLWKAFRKALLPLKKGGRKGFMSPHFKKLN